MKAVQLHTYGTADHLSLEEVTRPEPAEGEVLIRVYATTVNPFDCAARAGYLQGYFPYNLPLILGLDISGIVEVVGQGVSEFAPGDAVYARTDPSRNGAYAEYVAVAASEVAAKPAGLEHIQAAALPHVGLTAWRMLIDAANIAEGQTVLIHAAAGGVGSFAVQLAKWRGAKVIGTASMNNLEFVRGLGADEVVDYTATPFEEVVQGVDVVLDTVGGETQERSWAVLKSGGLLLSIVQQPSEEKAAAHGVRQQMVAAMSPAGGVLKQIAALVESGHIRPVVSSVLGLEEIQQAHRAVEGRHNRGKLVLRVAD
jgi:NADPH:quinone reductase-like Zn-dependent oxidoreductase